MLFGLMWVPPVTEHPSDQGPAGSLHPQFPRLAAVGQPYGSCPCSALCLLTGSSRNGTNAQKTARNWAEVSVLLLTGTDSLSCQARQEVDTVSMLPQNLSFGGYALCSPKNSLAIWMVVSAWACWLNSQGLRCQSSLPEDTPISRKDPTSPGLRVGRSSFLPHRAEKDKAPPGTRMPSPPPLVSLQMKEGFQGNGCQQSWFRHPLVSLRQGCQH